MPRFQYLNHRFHNQRPYWLQFVFAGQAFSVSHRVTVADGATTYIQISTSLESILHISKINIATENEALGIELIRDPDFTAGTTPIPTINLDDRSAKVADTNFYSDPTNVSGGTVLFEGYVPQGSASKGGTVVSGLDHLERLFDYSTDYIIAITNEGNSTTDVMFNMSFYESSN